MASSYFSPDEYAGSTLTLVPHNDAFATKRVAVPEGQMVLVGRVQEPADDQPTIPRFHSKIVSRRHAWLLCRGGKATQFYLQDAGSSSGTFLRKAGAGDQVASRLSEAGQESDLIELDDGDLIVLGAAAQVDGVDYSGIEITVRLPGHTGDVVAPAARGVAALTSSLMERPSSGAGAAEDGALTGDDSNNLQTLERDTDAEFNRVWQDLVAPLSSFAQPALGQTVAPFSKEMLGHLRHIPANLHAAK